MARYNTEQRKILYEFFQSHPHEQFSVKTIHTILSDYNISTSATYRNLATMQKEELILCHTNPETREMIYQYIGGDE